MNRKKKIKETLKKKAKKANAKLHKSNKPKYISKAERAAQEANINGAVDESAEQNLDQEN
jgi:transcription initiation factor TFIIIB Brf1 subunit/transcription initiation factor TFIIB